jgi:hypothetical protein
MKKLWQAIDQLSSRKKLALLAMLILILLTWSAVCLVVIGVLGP